MEKEERIERFTKLAKRYKDSPQNRQDILLPYIKELAAMTEKERRELSKVNQDLYWVSKKTPIGESFTSCSHDRAIFLDATSILTSNGKESYSYAMRENDIELFRSILDIYNPKWLNKQIDEVPFSSQRYGYHNILKLAEDGYIKLPKPERIADLMAEAHEIRLGNRDISFDSSKLLQLPVTLNEHVWYLFEYPTFIYHQDERAKIAFAEGKTHKDESISALLLTCTKTGRISSRKLLDKTIAGLNLGMGNLMEKWFIDLLEAYQPTNEELLERQDSLIQTLYTVKSRAQNAILKLLKQIVKASNFSIQPYIDTTQSLLFSLPANSLTVICSTYEVLIKSHPDCREKVYEALSQLLMHKNDSIKKRASKLLATYSGEKLAELQQQINASQPELPTLEASQPHPYCMEENRLASIQDKDEFIFSLSRLFDTTDPLEIWTIVSAVAEWFPRLEEADQTHLESVFARAKAWIGVTERYLQAILASYLLEFGLCLQQRFAPKASKGKQLTDLLIRGILGKKKINGVVFTPLEDLRIYNNTDDPLDAFRLFLLELIGMMEAGNPVVLSVPTHRPGYIDADILIQRLAEYEQRGLKPSPYDLQVALDRCTWQTDKPVNINLSGELKQLMDYLINDRFTPCKHYEYPEAWLTVNLRNHPEAMRTEFSDFYFNHRAWTLWTGQLPLSSQLAPKQDFKQLQFDYSSKLLYSPTQPILWQERLWNFQKEWFMEPQADLHLSVFPHHATIVLAQILRKCAVFNHKQTFYTKAYMGALQWLMDYQEPWNETDLLFLATALVHYDTIVRTYAAEVWAIGTHLSTIDNRILGEQTARLIVLKAFPLRRLQSVIEDCMRHRSTLHDAALRQFLSPIIASLPDKMTGAKGIRGIVDTLQS
ncbi:DUF6493 family protein [Prevotella sp. S7 MS 2]|uniref:DUF6493 family protein n=1 Tax=Prevotella sp. S7 MS 2 TaxID=1287488 RepID=UPI0005139E03|nr:DUF6493 family protein [Prevotella sp. S7 MS 2]KGI59827.1 hypothetical protein HMPREF0671_09360 [Prevotella sp. S7 MS 2]